MPSKQNSGQGKGQGSGGNYRSGAGPGGSCLCPNCGTRVPHKAGTPCMTITCPQCGTQMMRD